MRNSRAIYLTGIACIACLGVFAQANTAAISGYVKDARTKKPLIEAVVSISSDAFTGQKFALTDSTGIYSIKNLQPGTYTVTFEMEGYRKFTQENIVLKQGMSLGVSFQMARDDKNKRTKAVEKLDINKE
jgi:uncharacterized protein (DUF2141 family)